MLMVDVMGKQVLPPAPPHPPNSPYPEFDLLVPDEEVEMYPRVMGAPLGSFIRDFHTCSEVYLLHVLRAQKQASEHQTCGPSGPWFGHLGPWGQG